MGLTTADEVAEATRDAINFATFGVPDLRGQFIRGWDTRSTEPLTDRSYLYRYSVTPGYYGNLIGSLEFDTNKQHTHTQSINQNASKAGTNADGAEVPESAQTGESGWQETKPTNMALNAIIKY
jgi:hypothetical protein